MAEADRITEDSKKLIVGLLNEAMQVEYGVILNYPRILDRIVHMDQVQSQDFADSVERLGRDSFRHATVVAKLIEDLGGEPAWDMVVIDRMIDVESMLVEQLGKEKLMTSVYKEARQIAQKSPAKAKGFFDRLKNIGQEPREEVSRSKVIEILTGLESDEQSHIKRVENALIQMNIKSEN